MYSNKNISVFGALSPGYTSFNEEVHQMYSHYTNKLLNIEDVIIKKSDMHIFINNLPNSIPTQTS